MELGPGAADLAISGSCIVKRLSREEVQGLLGPYPVDKAFGALKEGGTPTEAPSEVPKRKK